MRQIVSPLEEVFSPFKGKKFSPRALFALAEPGIWYDPSDMSTLFQDTAGTVPVTTPGQTVGLMLDKSKGLVLGAELVTNGGFDTDAAWTRGTGWTISGGVASIASSGFNQLSQDNVFPALGTYRITFTMLDYVSGGLGVNAGSGTSYAVASGNGEKTLTVTNAGANPSRLLFTISGTSNFSIDNISVRELPGNHATQPTASARPTYGIVPATGRRNLLTYTEQFDNGVWQKAAQGAAFTPVVTANAGLAPDGTMTADRVQFSRPTVASPNRSQVRQTVTMGNDGTTLSVWMKSFSGADQNVSIVNASANLGNENFLVTNEWQRFDIQSTSVLAVGSQQFWIGLHDTLTPDLAADVLIWGAQLELGSTATPYQRVTTQFDVTEAGVASLGYLGFDGVDDFLVTPTITPGTDKVQVFAGVRKLSDATTGAVIGLSAVPWNTSGCFEMYAPLYGNGYGFGSRGTGGNWTDINPTGYPAPTSSVVVGLGDISGDLATLRVKAVQVAQSTVDQGMGNFLAYPLFIGRRGGTSMPFNGNLYSIIARFGANLTADQITATETWVAAKTGVTL